MTALLTRHGPALMRVARQASMCHDDAMDALQRALEIYVRRLDHVEIATEAAWLKVVIRHEAYAIRRSRGDCVAAPEFDLDTVVATPDRSVEERVLAGDRVSRSAHALRALKPDEARALMLKAHGLSYDEIGRHCGWTYTKVNRCITEGRRRFLEAYDELESGSACDRFAPALAALAGGVATSEQMVDLRPHLRACPACRATVRDLHLSALRRFRVLGPIPAVGWLWERLRGGRLPDPTVVSPSPSPDGAIERIHPIIRVKQDVTQLMHRAGNADVTTGVQIALASGGGRMATVGALVGLCLSGLGAGTVCVVRGVSPLGWLHPDPKPARVHRVVLTPTPTPALAASTLSPPPKRAAVVTPRATPAPRKAAVRVKPEPSSRTDPSQGRTPTSQQHAPISPAPPAARNEFAAAPVGGPGASAAPAATPATGGSEFGP